MRGFWVPIIGTISYPRPALQCGPFLLPNWRLVLYQHTYGATDLIVNRGAIRSLAKYFQPDIGSWIAFDAQVCRHGGYQLFELGGTGVVGDQQAPLIAVDGAGLDGCAQHGRHQELHQLVTGRGFARQCSQAGESGCFAGGLFDGDGVMPAVGLGHERAVAGR